MVLVLNVVTIFIKEFIALFSEMAPFLLFGFLLAGVIHVWLPNRLYVSKISKPTFKSVFWAALFGIPLPICSCGVIPTSIAIRREGASKGASVSFLISTPATGADSILATYSLLGFPFALLRPIAAFLTALFGGILTNVLTKNEKEFDVENCCRVEQKISKKFCTNNGLLLRIKETFRYGFVDMVTNVRKWLCIGLVLGALIAAFVPNDFFLALREYPLLCMLMILVLAMPMYTCATGSIPLALALVAKGITPGAALVFLMAGPATSLASMFVVGKAFGKRTLAAYLLSIASGALFFGFIIDVFFMDTFLSSMLSNSMQNIFENHHLSISALNYVCAGLLGLLMIYSKVSNGFKRTNHCGCTMQKKDDEHCSFHEHFDDISMNSNKKISKTYKILGMSCVHCKECVETAVKKLDGVTFALADVTKKELYIEGSVNEIVLKKVIEDAGFKYGGEI